MTQIQSQSHACHADPASNVNFRRELEFKAHALTDFVAGLAKRLESLRTAHEETRKLFVVVERTAGELRSMIKGDAD